MRRAAKKDANHNAIAAVFESEGCTVADTSALGGDFPDMVVARNGYTALVEVKSGRGKLTAGQRRFFEGWQGLIFMVSTELEARAIARNLGQ